MLLCTLWPRCNGRCSAGPGVYRDDAFVTRAVPLTFFRIAVRDLSPLRDDVNRSRLRASSPIHLVIEDELMRLCVGDDAGSIAQLLLMRAVGHSQYPLFARLEAVDTQEPAAVIA